MDLWIVFDIGCLCCGTPSNIVGVFDDKEIADAVADKCHNSKYWLSEGGMNSFKVFKMPEVNKLNPDYNEIMGDQT